MAQVETGNSGNGKKSKPQKKLLRVDFTPMVDMNMLLITFFMFCSTLSKPQIMDIAMPTNDNIEISDPTLIPESKTVTAILGENDKVFYYEGKPNYKDYKSLKETDVKGFRDFLLAKNKFIVKEINELKEQQRQKKISPNELKELIVKAKKSKEGSIVVVKPTNASRYENLVGILDEMQICNVGSYAIVDMTEGDQFLIDNYNSGGKLMANKE